MSTLVTDVDSSRMLKALRLAQKGLGTTSPNPPVGALIYAGDKLIGQGYHEKAGEDHAERRAVQDAINHGNGYLLKGATLYVTLEPCSSYGKTPPCTCVILQSGLARVVYGMQDPDERHRGRAKALLEAKGVQVCTGVQEEACSVFLRPWVYSLQTGLPWVTAKVGCTLDSRLVRLNERWISCKEALRFMHELRLQSDAILVGGTTVRTDDPALTIRTPISQVPACKQQPWRVVLTRDRSLLPANARLFTDSYAERTLVYERVEEFQAVLSELRDRYGVVRLMLECGGNLLRQFLEHGLVREWVQDIAPIICGGNASMIPGEDYLPNELHLSEVTIQQAGIDFILRGLVKS